ncbi:hypothetical protein GC722_02225 [Auraticoccus sp. F435]|uniref:Uncharacterized protein n=1 Tax=Auraticoccus cholistanensis TaxID=2656650 RepID=A0A6A9UQ49_9ACTN|nr:hypothetical protein [Auraticoccus cholistanensis]MVA74853.1 hypothetical protein [Auraticoccus cholistanensis]
MNLPVHPHLLVLRTAATLVLAALIGQAGWAAAGIGRDPRWFGLHETFAWVTLAVCLASLVVYVVLRRTAGRLLVTMAAVVAVLPLVQIGLAEARVIDAHVFVGVLTVMVGTALTSWTYRHKLPAAD